MKIKVLKSKQTKFASFFTPVKIVVKGEEEKGEQDKTLTVRFSESATKKLPVGFKGGIIECKGENVNAPYVYEIKTVKDEKTGEDKPDYPFVYIKDIETVTDLPVTVKNTCTFVVDEEETTETEIK